jgi:hypothetical protein
VLKHLARIIAAIRLRWPTVKILVRADSGFCREHLMSWCEHNGVDYLFGLAKNARLLRQLQPALEQAKQQFALTQKPTRVFHDFSYQTLDSWSRQRRVVGKAEHLDKGPNPRFVVTSLSSVAFTMQPLYELEYCSRGDMENRIKEQQLMLFADRVSCQTMRANQVRLCLATVAYVVMRALRQFGLGPTPASAVADVGPASLPSGVEPMAATGIVPLAEAAAVEPSVADVPTLSAAETPVAPMPAEPRSVEPTVGNGVVAFAESSVAGATPEEPTGAGALLVAALMTVAQPAGVAATPVAVVGPMTRSPQAQCDTIRLRLLKIGAVVRVSARRVWVSFSEAYPFREWFLRVWENLRRLRLGEGSANGGTG